MRPKSLLGRARFSPVAASWISAIAGTFFFLVSLSVGERAFSQELDSRKILAFAEAWRGPHDYIWTRESVSRINPNSQRGLRIKDTGRIRIEALSYERESVVLDPHILLYRFETEFPGQPVEKRVSPLEGTDLPLVWLHSVMGFSIGLEPGTRKGANNAHQAAEVLELLDFRGFVPDATPVNGKEWSTRTEREADSTYAFSESVSRKFKCVGAVPEGESAVCSVRFEELVTVTPGSPTRTSEIRERTGTYKVRMPEGLIEEVVWNSTATEYSGTGDKRRKIATETKAQIQRRQTPEGRPRDGRPIPDKSKTTDLPKPPR